MKTMAFTWLALCFLLGVFLAFSVWHSISRPVQVSIAQREAAKESRSFYLTPPSIPGYHWRCSEEYDICSLYDAKGQEAASIIGADGVGASQGCVFNYPEPCKDYETDKEAFDYIVRRESKP